MPFTFSHPALIIPLKYLPARYFSITGLVIGSIAPDFEKFIKMSGGNIYSHTLAGIFWFNLPLALVLAFVFHLVVRDVLVDNLPLFFRERLERFKSFKWTLHFKKYPGAVVCSILIGVILHIALDSFTHRDAPLIYLFPYLLKWITFGPFFSIGYVTLMWVVILDLSVSILGLLYIIYTFIRLPTEAVKKEKKSFLPFWGIVILLSLVIVMLKFIFGGALINNWQLIYICIGAGLMSIFFSSVLWKKMVVS
jgi:hypothetical protein